jgi:hypothetical protein
VAHWPLVRAPVPNMSVPSRCKRSGGRRRRRFTFSASGDRKPSLVSQARAGMTENQFFDFIGADELTKKTLIEAHRHKRYRKSSQLVYSSNGSGDCMFTLSGEQRFIRDALDWLRMIGGTHNYYLANNNSRRTNLLCQSIGRYLEYCSSHPFSFDECCTGCENAVSKPYTVYPSNHIYHGRFLNIEKSRISDQVI